MNKREVYNINESLKPEHIKESLMRMLERQHPIGSYIEVGDLKGTIKDFCMKRDEKGDYVVDLSLDYKPEYVNMTFMKKMNEY